jgi:hypothetical protein
LKEESKGIKGYEEIYDITRSGRIVVKRNNSVRHRNGDEYGYTYVDLHKYGDRKRSKTFDLWKEVWLPVADINEYKGK